MKKAVVFLSVIIALLGLISVRGITGMSVVETAGSAEFANIGISAIGLVIVTLIFLLYHRESHPEPAMESDVWDELARAEEEWEEGK